MNSSALIFSLGLAGLSPGADEVDFATLPQRVQVTINRELAGGRVHEIRQELTNGHSVFIVGIRNEGERRQLRVDAKGRLN